MADVIAPTPPASTAPRPASPGLPSAPQPIPQKKASGGPRLDLASPVNQNGSFDFDRVLKSGDVYKRSRHTKQWKRFHLVLRPHLLSFYKNASEEKLHKQVQLSDLTAVAALKDPKGRREHMFGLFSPARNYHFQAGSAADAREWVGLISREARIDEEDESMIFGSPLAEAPTMPYFVREGMARQSTSSPEPAEPYVTKHGVPIPGILRTSLQEEQYSGGEQASYSDFSDTAPSRAYADASFVPVASINRSAVAEDRAIPAIAEATESLTASVTAPVSSTSRPRTTRNISGRSTADDDERVIWHGHLLALKSKGGVRQWKKLWVVVRRKHIAFYKNEDEYAAHLIIPMSNIISAVEIDPVSRSKAHCLQIIAEEKSYRFCAQDEDSLLRCLGALKSQLAKRKEQRRGAGGADVA